MIKNNNTLQLLTDFINTQKKLKEKISKEKINQNSKEIMFLEKKRNSNFPKDKLSSDNESFLFKTSSEKDYKAESTSKKKEKEIEIEKEEIGNKLRIKKDNDNYLANTLIDSNNLNNLKISSNKRENNYEENILFDQSSGYKESKNDYINKKVDISTDSINTQNIQTNNLNNLSCVKGNNLNVNNSNLDNRNNVVKVIKNKKIVYVNSSYLLDSYYSKNLKTVKKVVFIGRTKRNSKYRGVSKNGSQWQVLFMHQKEKTYAGCFPSEEIAARVYDILAIKKRGIKARTNYLYSIEEMQKINEMNIDLKAKNIDEIIANLFY